MTSISKKKVLVIGDLMLDIAKTLRSRSESSESTSQSHAGVFPFQQVHPFATTCRPGGAGLAALALTGDPNIEVHLLSGASSGSEIGDFAICGIVESQIANIKIREDVETLCQDPQLKYVQYLEKWLKLFLSRHYSEVPRVRWHWLEPVPPAKAMTILKERHYSNEKLQKGNSYFYYRADNDPPYGSLLSNQLPSSLESNYDAIVIMDFGKHTVSEALLTSVFEKYPATPVFVDSKQPRIAEFCIKWSFSTPVVLILNREETAKFLKHSFADYEFSLSSQNNVITSLRKVRNRFQRDCEIVVKLDKEGAIAFKFAKGILTCSTGTTPELDEALSIGAGDFFVAGFVTDRIQNAKSGLKSATKVGLVYAYRWMKFNGEGFWNTKFHKEPGTDIVIRELPWPQDMADYEVDCTRITVKDEETIE